MWILIIGKVGGGDDIQGGGEIKSCEYAGNDNKHIIKINSLSSKKIRVTLLVIK